MRIQISARHCEIADSIRDRAREQVRKLHRFEPRLAGAEVVFEEEGHRKTVEAVLSVDGVDPVVASAEDDDFRRALEQMIDRAGRRLRKVREQQRDHQGPKLSEAPFQEAGGGGE